MALTDAYLVTTKNFEAVFNAIQGAKAPDRFTQKFLENLGFTSSNDRLYIKLLKALRFVDESGVPGQRYFDFLDQSQARAVLGEAIAEAYSDLFLVNREAYKMSLDEVQNKLKTLTQGKKSDNVLRWMANTFVSLCSYADWQGVAQRKEVPGVGTGANETERGTTGGESPQDAVPPLTQSVESPLLAGGLHYNIQVHLPESRDPSVYDAIFQALRRHLR